MPPLLSFWELYRLLRGYRGHRLHQDVLLPSLPGVALEVKELTKYAKMNSAENVYDVTDEDLWKWYALNRVNDWLLLGFQRDRGVDWDAPFQSGTYREFMDRVGYAALVHWNGPGLTLAEYRAFFEGIGFRTFEMGPFCPFFHEIVEVVEDPTYVDPVVEHVFWPGLMFGALLFSRAGVRVRCRSGVTKKDIAERSQLYFTFWRRRREAVDLSHGWGSNSQWRTRMRRDYLDGETLHYNVDGKYELKHGYQRPRPILPGKAGPDDDLSLDERIELLTNRCLVRSSKCDRDLWPYDDRHSECAPGCISANVREKKS
jgi:hypothetical protein